MYKSYVGGGGGEDFISTCYFSRDREIFCTFHNRIHRLEPPWPPRPAPPGFCLPSSPAWKVAPTPAGCGRLFSSSRGLAWLHLCRGGERVATGGPGSQSGGAALSPARCAALPPRLAQSSQGDQTGRTGQEMAEAAQRGSRCWLWVLLCAGSWSLMLCQSTETKEVAENQSVSLPCNARSGQGTPSRLEWRFQGSGTTDFVYYGDKLTDRYKDRAKFYPNELYLESVTRKDMGAYTCQVVGNNGLTENTVRLIVQVPPSKPLAQVPSSVTIGNRAVLTCVETDGSPPPTFKWFKNDMVMPEDPKTNTLFKNSSYTLDPKSGVLIFEPATSFDAGDYSCEAFNNIGTPQKSEVVRLEPSEVNVGGIVAAVVVLLIVFGLAAFGIWFAYSRGYFSKGRDSGSKKVIYSQPSTRSDGEFKQTSSFLV